MEASMHSVRTLLALALVTLAAAGCGAFADPSGPPRIGEDTCGHDLCAAGVLVDATCHPCATSVCAIDPFCCDVSWDRLCVAELEGRCDETCPAACGDTICGGDEDCASCPADCGECPACGNGRCEAGEDCGSCASDCGSCPACTHDTCVAGPPLRPECDSCTTAICAADAFCCTVSWDLLCVSEASSICGHTCGDACGDGVLGAGEVCDDGNNLDGDGCSHDCLSAEVCGNGILDVFTGELCDDGNAMAGDGCSPTCVWEVCGNGIIDPGEECDDGLPGSATCDPDCTVAYCGDSIVNPARGEECDTGVETAACDADCTVRVCGDGYVNPAAGEECDDANVINSDACLSTCSVARCGDGFIWVGVEVCDDGNTVGGDGCAADCSGLG
jgi:cysteine-rich repeat protein